MIQSNPQGSGYRYQDFLPAKKRKRQGGKRTALPFFNIPVT